MDVAPWITNITTIMRMDTIVRRMAFLYGKDKIEISIGLERLDGLTSGKVLKFYKNFIYLPMSRDRLTYTRV